MGISCAFLGVGSMVGPILSGILLDTFADYDWIISLTIAAYAVAFVAMLLAHSFVESTPPVATHCSTPESL